MTTNPGRSLVTAILAFAAATAAAVPAARAAPDAVEVGTSGAISDAVLYIADRKGLFKEEGIAATMRRFNDSIQLIAPLGIGQLDVAAGATSAGLFNSAARGIDLKIVADKGSTPPGYNYMPLVVRKDLIDDGKVKSFADLKGLKIALTGDSGSPGSTLNEALKRGGLGFHDVQHVTLSYPQQVSAFANRAIDASVITEPSLTQAIAGNLVQRFSDDTVYPDQQVAVLLYGGNFIAKRPDVARRFMIAYVKAARIYNDALKDGHFAGPAAPEVIKILLQDTRVKDPELFAKMTPNGIDPDGRVNLASLRKDLAFFKEQGFLEKDVPLEQVVDTSFVEEAVRKLGPYKPHR